MTTITRKERIAEICEDIEYEWEEEYLMEYIKRGVKANGIAVVLKNEMTTPNLLRRHPELLIGIYGECNADMYVSNKTAPAEMVYELATSKSEANLKHYFAPYFRCSKRFMEDYANWRWDDVEIDWKEVSYNVHLSRQFIEKYMPPEHISFALSAHYTVDELVTFDSIYDAYNEYYGIFSMIGMKGNKHITSEFIMNHRDYYGFHNYINFYTYDGMNMLNEKNYPLVCWNDFTTEYFDGLLRDFGVDTYIIVKLDDVMAHPAITQDYFNEFVVEAKCIRSCWTWFARYNPNCTLKFLDDNCGVMGIVLWYNNFAHEKGLFVERKAREHLAAYKIQQWWVFMTSSPEYAVGRRRIEAGYDAEFGGEKEKM